MGTDDRLVDMLHKELERLDDKQRNKFREALKHELRTAVRRAAQAAQKAKAPAAG